MAATVQVVRNAEMSPQERSLLGDDMRHMQRLNEETGEPFFLAETERLLAILNNDILLRPRLRPAGSVFTG
jgi:hypothetical protein